MNPSNKRRSRRLCKKLHFGEFQELGFAFEVDLNPSITPDQEQLMASSLLSEIVEPRSLTLGGWISGGFIACSGHGSVTEEDRSSILNWFGGRPEIAVARVGPLVDAWYPPDGVLKFIEVTHQGRR